MCHLTHRIVLPLLCVCLLAGTNGPVTAQVTAVNAYPGITIQYPIGFVTPPDGTDRIFIVGQVGQIYEFPNSPSATAKVFLDIHDSVVSNAPGGELGLLGLAFHPHFATNGYFYVNYTIPYNVSGYPYQSIIARFHVSGSNPDSADRSSELVLMRINQPFSNHKGGQLAFGPDGYLYCGLGDGGSGGDPLGNGQSTSTWLGKILRINVDSAAGPLNYSIPPDNPFASDTSSTVKKEIFAYGLRNPWRFSFDVPGGGTLWVGDVGQNLWEEIDTVLSGRNYGWNIMEGFHCYNPPSGCDTTGLTMPIWEYDHNGKCAIIGGAVYRGSALPWLTGKYIYGDYCSGQVWALDPNPPGPPTNALLFTAGSMISSFGTDQHGETYICAYNNGIIYKIVPAAPQAPALVSPANAQTSVGITPQLLWHSAVGAAAYHLQVGLDPAFSAVVLDDSTLTDTSRAAGTLSYLTTYYWHVKASNVTGSSAYSATWSFTTAPIPTPPPAPVLIAPADGAGGLPDLVSLVWHAAPGAAFYKLQVAPDTTFGVPIVDDTAITDTSRQVGPLAPSTTFYWRVLAKNSAGSSAYSTVRSFQTASFSAHYAVNRFWNMLCVPLSVPDSALSVLFPTAISKAFDYSSSNGYVPRDTLVPGVGYWLKFPDTQTVAITGTPLTSDTISVQPGWNMIGSIAASVQTDSVIQEPSGIVISPYFGFDGSYIISTVIQPPNAYWVKVNSAGTLILRSSAAVPTRK